MKQKLLLTLFIASLNLAVNAQKTTAYAITSPQKGQNNWTEVRLIDIASGDELKTVYQSSQETQILNARTGKPVVKKDAPANNLQVIRMSPDANNNFTPITTEQNGKTQLVRKEMMVRLSPSLDKPFSTYSAACAYDKKHDRLYYTPMGIAQLRYIDLKSKTPQVFYFEEETFGALRNRGDVPNQITRMVIGADGNGYALTNNADHLIQFTTNKKATITDLGALTDDPANGKFTVHSPGGYGGDIIAAKSGELYLITANHNIFKIDMKSMTATYRGTIQGLPKGYSTNGAAVEDGSMVLVNSSNSTLGYYHFDINKLNAEKVGNSESVYNASDLANSNLLSIKKNKKEEQQEVVVPQEVVETQTTKEKIIENNGQQSRISVYPNPVMNGEFNLSFENYAPGKYQAQLIDVTGKQISSRSFTINSKSQTEKYVLPQLMAKGNYLIQIIDQSNKTAGSNKLVVQ